MSVNYVISETKYLTFKQIEVDKEMLPSGAMRGIQEALRRQRRSEVKEKKEKKAIRAVMLVSNVLLTGHPRPKAEKGIRGMVVPLAVMQ